MTLEPAQFLLTLLLGLVAFAVLLVATGLLLATRRRRPIVRVDPRRTDATATAWRASDWHEEQRQQRRRRLLLVPAAFLALAVLAGRHAVSVAFPSESVASAPAARTEQIDGADGTRLTVTHYGAHDGPTLVLTHGWGADRTEWRYAISQLPHDLHVVVWDLPGLGQSSGADAVTLPALAADLDRVVSSVGGSPVILVGHSIGGMVNLEYARRYPDKVGTVVQGLMQLNTTYTNPIETKRNADTARRRQASVYEPALRMVERVSPVARTLGWFAYQSGLAHLQLASQSFAGQESWEQLDHMASYAYRSSPGVVARGVLAMLQWDATDVLPTIDVPTLIVSGAQDVTTLPTASERMAREIPDATHVSIDPAAHLGPVEQYARYAQAIASFARTTAQDGAAMKVGLAR